MKRLLFVLCILSIISCKKTNSVNQGLSDNNHQVFDLMSTNNGSWWMYQSVDSHVIYRLATGRDSFKEGLTLNYFERYDTTSGLKTHYPEYFGKNSGKYLNLIDIDGTETTYLTYVILLDNWCNGQNWDNKETKFFSSINLNADILIHSNVVDVNQHPVYNNKTYDSVIYVHSDVWVRPSGLAIPPPYSNCGTLDVWFKRGVGIVHEKGNINIAGVLTQNTEDWIIDYHIAP